MILKIWAFVLLVSCFLFQLARICANVQANVCCRVQKARRKSRTYGGKKTCAWADTGIPWAIPMWWTQITIDNGFNFLMIIPQRFSHIHVQTYHTSHRNTLEMHSLQLTMASNRDRSKRRSQRAQNCLGVLESNLEHSIASWEPPEKQRSGISIACTISKRGTRSADKGETIFEAVDWFKNTFPGARRKQLMKQ